VRLAGYGGADFVVNASSCRAGTQATRRWSERLGRGGVATAADPPVQTAGSGTIVIELTTLDDGW